MDIAQLVLIAVLVVYLIVRRFQGQPLKARSFVLPLALTVWGVYQLRDGHVTALDAGFLVASAIVGLLAGTARGATIKIFTRDGHLWQRYRPVTLLVWVATILLRLGMSSGGHLIGVHLSSSSALPVMFGVSLLAEGVVVAARAARTGVPYAPSRRGDAAGRGGRRRRSAVGSHR